MLAVLVVIHYAGQVRAAQVRGVQFDDYVTVGDTVLNVRGGGLLTWFFFKVYIAVLYLPPDVPSDKALDDLPKKMEFYYLTDMDAGQFAESGEHLLLRNVSTVEYRRLEDRINAINKMYRDVVEGDRYTLTYMPGTGTELALNGRVLGTIRGYDFASVYYRIWLGEDPVDDELKRALLYREKDTKNK